MRRTRAGEHLVRFGLVLRLAFPTRNPRGQSAAAVPKNHRFRSGRDVSTGNGATKSKNHEKKLSQRARTVGHAWAKSFFTACGHTGFKCNTLFENFPSTRAARWWASAALT